MAGRRVGFAVCEKVCGSWRRFAADGSEPTSRPQRAARKQDERVGVETNITLNIVPTPELVSCETSSPLGTTVPRGTGLHPVQTLLRLKFPKLGNRGSHRRDLVRVDSTPPRASDLRRLTRQRPSDGLGLRGPSEILQWFRSRSAAHPKSEIARLWCRKPRARRGFGSPLNEKEMNRWLLVTALIPGHLGPARKNKCTSGLPTGSISEGRRKFCSVFGRGPARRRNLEVAGCGVWKTTRAT
jgi:hypothetical protein